MDTIEREVIVSPKQLAERFKIDIAIAEKILEYYCDQKYSELLQKTTLKIKKRKVLDKNSLIQTGNLARSILEDLKRHKIIVEGEHKIYDYKMFWQAISRVKQKPIRIKKLGVDPDDIAKYVEIVRIDDIVISKERLEDIITLCMIMSPIVPKQLAEILKIDQYMATKILEYLAQKGILHKKDQDTTSQV